MQDLWQDMRYGVRILLRKPGFTVIAVMTLALGIGANTAIFSVVNGVLLKSLPYRESEKLVRLFETVDRGSTGSDRMEVAPANFIDWQSQSQSFSGLAAYALTGTVLNTGGEAERLEGALVTADFFGTLGAMPVQGRTFRKEDERAQDRLAIISYDLWQRRLGGTDNVVGSSIQLDEYPFTIIGIMPRGFEYPRQTQVYELYRLSPSQRQMREARFLKVIGRLRPEVTLTQVRAEMAGMAGRLADEYPQTNRSWSVNVVPLLEEQVGKVQPALLLLLAVVALVLLIACANVASLLLAQAVARQGEIAVRLALGAGRLRIVRQLLTESVLLAIAGGALGMLVGAFGVDALLAMAPANLPRMTEVNLDGRVLGFTLVASLLTGLLFGLVPAWQAVNQDVNESLKEGAGRTPGHRRGRRIFGALVIGEVALAFIALAGAGLLGSSFWRLQRIEPGIDVERLLTVQFEPPSARYNGDDWKAHRLNFWNELSARVAALPGVEAVGAVDSLPFGGRARSWRFRKAGETQDVATAPAASFQVTTPDYFRTVGMRLQRGRIFASTDIETAPLVVIVNETMARRFWPDGNVIGQRIFVRNEETSREIVGVVSDVHHFGLERPAEPEMYVPFAQFVIDVMPMVVRVRTNPAQLTKVVREQVRAVDASVAIAEIRPMKQLVSESLSERRFTVVLLGVFAAVALLLAGFGLYGVMGYAVKQRTREIGIRIALGAQSSDVMSLVIRHGLRLTLLGVGVGLAMTLSLTRLIASLLFGVSANDPITLVGVTILLTVVALLACYVPARRALKVDPINSLRSE